MDLKDLMTADEAAALIGITPNYVCQLCREKELEGIKLSPRRWMVVRKSAEKMKKEHAPTGRPRTSVAASRRAV